MIDKVKGILARWHSEESPCRICCAIAEEICQLSEPKPKRGRMDSPLNKPRPDEGRLLTDEEKPWDKENWRQAKGVKFKVGQTNSAFAERDYSVKCEAQHLITKVKGYWIWWCSSHHQPLAWCRKGKTEAQDAKTASIIRAEYNKLKLIIKTTEEAALTLKQLTEFNKDAECQEKIKDAMRQRQSWLANVCGWRNPEQIEALCQERVERIADQLEQDIYALELDLRVEDLTALYGLVQSLKEGVK